MHAFVIAEAASTHDGDYGKALRLIELASNIGADACKFQWVSKAERLCERRNAPEYFSAYKLIEFPEDWLKGLANYCQTRNVEFMCTVYLPEDIEVIAPYVKRFKASSFESQDKDFVGALDKYREHSILLSLGMNGAPVLWPGSGVKYLHCISAYPTPVDQIELLRLRAWPFTGISDHTRSPLTGAFAVCVGANIVEFHMRLDDTSPENADYTVSRDPDEAREYVANIRLAETMLGDGVKRVMSSEESMLKFRVKA